MRYYKASASGHSYTKYLDRFRELQNLASIDEVRKPKYMHSSSRLATSRTFELQSHSPIIVTKANACDLKVTSDEFGYTERNKKDC